MGHNRLRISLQAWNFVLVFFSVPPSTRQAAGPLTENLPNVFAGDPQRVDLSLDNPSPRGTKRRLVSRDLPAAPLVNRFIVGCIQAIMANGARFLLGATPNRLTTQRGQFA
jgi:hypothetical protein